MKSFRISIVIVIVIVIAAAAAGGSWLLGSGGASKERQATEQPQNQVQGTRPPIVSEASLPASSEDMKGRIDGLVVDEEGEPALDAEVWVEWPNRKARVEEDGSFAVTGLAERAYRVWARAETAIAGPVLVTVTEATEPVILHLRPGTSLSVQVVDDATAAPLADATVHMRGTAVGSVGSVDSAGRVQFAGLQPGNYTLVATAAGYGRAAAETWLSNGTTRTVTLRLASRTSAARGSVRSRGGDKLPNARVMFRSASAWAVPMAAQGVKTDDRGDFAIEDLPPGSYWFSAEHREHGRGTSALKTLASGQQTQVEIVLEDSATVVGRVEDSSGEGVPYASVFAAVPDLLDGGARGTVTDKEGDFSIRGLPHKEVSLHARHDLGSSARQTIQLAGAARAEGIVLSIEAMGSIAGLVVDEAGDRVTGAQVVLRAVGTGAQTIGVAHQVLTDAEGRFAVQGLTDAEYDVVARRAESIGRNNESPEQGQRVKTGRADVVVELAPLTTIKGRVVFADGKSPDLYRVGFDNTRYRARSFASATGRFELLEVPEGRYTLTIHGPSFDAKSIVAETHRGVVADLGDVTVTRGRSVCGVVLDERGLGLPNAQVVAGLMLSGGSASIDVGDRGLFSLRNRSARTDEHGKFLLSGLAVGRLNVVASRSTTGRSLPVSTVAGGACVELVVRPTASLAGSLTIEGVAPDGQVLVTAQTRDAPLVLQTVQPSGDGSFRFDELAPGSYAVSATTGNPLTGVSFVGVRTVEVELGKQAHVDIIADFAGGQVSVTPRNGASEMRMTVALAASGWLPAETLSDFLRDRTGADSDAWAWGLGNTGSASVLSHLRPGPATVCAIAMPSGVLSLVDVLRLMQEDATALQLSCAPLSVQAGTLSSLDLSLRDDS